MSAENAPFDYVFHWEGGAAAWSHLRVISFQLREELNQPFEARLILHARGADNEVDPETLVGSLGTLRIATLTTPAVRSLHGLIAEASELGSSRYGMVYEVLLVPPLIRAAFRSKSRIFLEKSTKQILETVLLGDPKVKIEDPEFEAAGSLTDPFEPARECVAFRLKDPSRLEDSATRPYCVQYNESDLAFVARLLAEEGLSYHFEHHAEAVVMVIADADAGRFALDPFDPVGPGVAGRQLDHVRLGRKLRSTRYRLVDYNWQKPSLDMKVEAKGEGDDSLAVDMYPGLYPDEPKQGELLAKARLERLQTEARYAEISSGCRLLGAGTVFPMTHTSPRYEGEYLVTKAELQGFTQGELGGDEAVGALADLPAASQARPFSAKLECVRRGTAESPDESKYRPPLLPKPRILGSQTAMVTSEPTAKDAEIHVGGPEGNENGCVRLKFHWDLESERHDKEPTSTWVRVSQVFAGAGGGAVFHPRVGTEVIVDFIDGDPDRPIVVGRVYNGQQPAAAKGKGAATVSTLKTMASPGGKVFNELQFDDTAGEEKVNLTAGKDWNTAVGNNREETVKNDSKSTVQANRTEATSADRSTTVGGTNTESVTGTETIDVGASQKLTIGASQTVSISAAQTIGVGAARDLTVGANHSVVVGASESYSIAAVQVVEVGASKVETIGAMLTQNVAAAATVNAGAAHIVNTPVAVVNGSATITHNTVAHTVNASATATINTTEFTAVAGGAATIQGATVTVNAAGEVLIEGGTVSIKGGSISLEAGSIKIAGGTVDITGGVVNVN